MLASKNVKLLNVLLLQADTLSSNIAKNQFPVLLRPIAERRRVTSVEFRPLLVDAMLTSHPQGFRIFFDSNGSDPSELQEQYANENRQRMMPPRLRFSLAHEIAHTFFYDLSEETPRLVKQFRSGGGRTELDHLEANCNKLAARMLLPTPTLRAALRSMKVVSPQALRDLSLQGGVSVEVLVRRLADQNSLFSEPYFRGCVVLVKESKEEVKVSAIAKPSGLNIARGLSLMRPGERWQLLDCDGKPLEPKQFQAETRVKLTVEMPRSSIQKYYRVAQMEIARSNSGISRLVTFEEVENR